MTTTTTEMMMRIIDLETELLGDKAKLEVLRTALLTTMLWYENDQPDKLPRTVEAVQLAVASIMDDIRS